MSTISDTIQIAAAIAGGDRSGKSPTAIAKQALEIALCVYEEIENFNHPHKEQPRVEPAAGPAEQDRPRE